MCIPYISIAKPNLFIQETGKIKSYIESEDNYGCVLLNETWFYFKLSENGKLIKSQNITPAMRDNKDVTINSHKETKKEICEGKLSYSVIIFTA